MPRVRRRVRARHKEARMELARLRSIMFVELDPGTRFSTSKTSNRKFVLSEVGFSKRSENTCISDISARCSARDLPI